MNQRFPVASCLAVCAGRPVSGQSGELVCVKPFPSMPTHFWNDADGKKYKNAYFNKFPGATFRTVITCMTLLGRLPNFGSRPNTIGGKFQSVRPSTKSLFDFDEIWYTGSTR